MHTYLGYVSLSNLPSMVKEVNTNPNDKGRMYTIDSIRRGGRGGVCTRVYIIEGMYGWGYEWRVIGQH